jgi:phage shock protein A
VSRLTFIFKAKLSKLLDRAERPDETLDYSYQRQLEFLQGMKSGIAEVVTAKKQLEMQSDRLAHQSAKLEGQARQALAVEREDLARLALERRSALTAQQRDLDEQVATLQAKQDQLVASQRALAERVARFRTEKETMKATYNAARAMVAIGEATTGLGQGMADAGLAIERARDKTAQMEARAGALDELISAGTLEDQLTPGQTQLDRELAALSSATQVDSELAKLKSELGSGEKKELPAG